MTTQEVSLALVISLILTPSLIIIAPTDLVAQDSALIRRAGVTQPTLEKRQIAQPQLEEDRFPQMVGSGLLLGIGGITTGWLLGKALTDSNEGGFLGAAALGSMAIPLGVHWGNDSQGELPLSMAASYGIGIVGVFVIGREWTDSSMRWGMAFPLLQLVTSTWIESVPSGDPY